MLTIGCHLSSSKGYLAMGKEAVNINANTFQFFTRNPRGSKAKDLNLKDIKSYLDYAREHRIEKILAHAPYTLNACSAQPSVREFARLTMADDLSRMEHTPGNCYNFHPGSHVGQGIEKGICQISEILNEILTPEQHTTVLLETMAGKGSEVGRTFEELKSILEKTFKTIEDIIETGEMTNGQLRKIIEKIEVDHGGNVDIYMKLTERLNLARTVPISGCLTYRHDGAACGDCSSFVGKVKGGFVLNLRSWRHLRDVAKISMKVENANRE